MIANQIILRPIITEKTMNKAGRNIFSFVVAGRATKIQIKKSIEKLFNVNVVKVATNMLKGGSIRTGRKRIEIKKQPTKKAFITLKEGQKIAVFETAQ